MDKAQAEHTRLALVGLLAEATDEERAKFNEAKTAIQGAIEVEVDYKADAFNPITIKEVFDC